MRVTAAAVGLIASLLAPAAATAGTVLGAARPASIAAVSPRAFAAAAGPLPLTYHGGPVMHATHTYAIYWVPSGYSVGATYRSTIDTYLADVASASGQLTNVYAVNAEYSDGLGPATYSSTFGGSVVSTTAFPANGCSDAQGDPVCLSDTQVEAQVAAVAQAQGWPRGLSTLVFLFTPPGVGSCAIGTPTQCSYQDYCAYHSWTTGTSGASTLLYANQPYPTSSQARGRCTTGVSPNGDQAADASINLVSHEHNEAITDPIGTGWYDDVSGNENGDNCAWQFGTDLGSTGAAPPAGYNQAIGTGRYELQQEWSNRASACVLLNAGPPNAPTAAVGLAGAGSVRVSFTPGAAPAGFPATSYRVTATPGGRAASGPGSPITVAGLTNGVAYTFTVTASNVLGTSSASAPSDPVTPLSVPGTPAQPTASPGDRSATVTFLQPSDGGSAIIDYTVVESPEGKFATGASSPLTVTGLTNGLAHTFTVIARNQLGVSPASRASAAVTPRTVPGAPTLDGVTAGDGSLSVAFTAPTDDGGAPINGYLVTLAPGGGTTAGLASPIVVPNLVNGAQYTVTVSALNDAGRSGESATSMLTSPHRMPGAPRIVAIAVAESTATVTYVPAAPNGSDPVTGFLLTAEPGAITAGAASGPITVAGLQPGVAYTITVRAVTGAGTSPPSPASHVVPRPRPGVPTRLHLTVRRGGATLTFVAPTNGRLAAVTSYTVTARSGRRRIVKALHGTTLRLVLARGRWKIVVVAHGARGSGPTSAAAVVTVR